MDDIIDAVDETRDEKVVVYDVVALDETIVATDVVAFSTSSFLETTHVSL